MSRLPKGFLGGFLDKPLSTGRYDGKQWALPFNTNVGLMFYRSDLVTPTKNVKGVPQIDWQTVEQAARDLPALRQKDPNIAAAYTSQLQDNEGLTVNGFEAIWAAGGDVVDQSGRVRFNRTVWQAGLARLAIPRPDSPAPDLVLPGSDNLDEVLSRDRFGSGQTVFMRNWPIEYGNLPVATPKFRVGVALLPGPSALGGADLAIARQSHYPRAAQALIQFLTADSSQRLLMERGGYAATRTSVYDDPAVQQKLPDLSVIKEAIAEARMRPVTPYYDRFSKVFSRAASAAISSGGALDPRLGDDLTKALQGG
jgi:multiple sugar transport system substrate-binding protein